MSTAISVPVRPTPALKSWPQYVINSKVKINHHSKTLVKLIFYFVCDILWWVIFINLCKYSEKFYHLCVQYYLYNYYCAIAKSWFYFYVLLWCNLWTTPELPIIICTHLQCTSTSPGFKVTCVRKVWQNVSISSVELGHPKSGHSRNCSCTTVFCRLSWNTGVQLLYSFCHIKWQWRANILCLCIGNRNVNLNAVSLKEKWLYVFVSNTICQCRCKQHFNYNNDTFILKKNYIIKKELYVIFIKLLKKMIFLNQN
jgi:hypothetical protein